MLPRFLKTAKSRRHTSTGILVNYTGAPWVVTYLHFIFTGFSNTTKSSRHTSTGILEALLGGYLPPFYINCISKIGKSRRHTSTGILVNYTKSFLGGYLHTIHINRIFKNWQKQQTHTHMHFGGLLRGFLGWLPTNILYKLEFSKTKSSRHIITGIYVDYPEGSLGGYLPTLYINWIFKKPPKAADTQAQAF